MELNFINPTFFTLLLAIIASVYRIFTLASQ